MTSKPWFWFVATVISAAVAAGSHFAGWNAATVIWIFDTAIMAANFGLMRGLKYA